MFKHILRIAAVAAVGIGCAVVADKWLSRNDEDEMLPEHEADENADVIDVTPEEV